MPAKQKLNWMSGDLYSVVNYFLPASNDPGHVRTFFVLSTTFGTQHFAQCYTLKELVDDVLYKTWQVVYKYTHKRKFILPVLIRNRLVTLDKTELRHLSTAIVKRRTEMGSLKFFCLMRHSSVPCQVPINEVIKILCPDQSES